MNTDQVGQPSVEDRMMAFVEQEDTPRPSIDEEEELPVDQNVAEEEESADEEPAEVEDESPLKEEDTGGGLAGLCPLSLALPLAPVAAGAALDAA